MEGEEREITYEFMDFDYLKPEDFDGLDSVELIPYTGAGKTSYAQKDKSGESLDIPKKEYLSQLGIQTPQEWLTPEGDIKKDCRALFISTFIVTGNILVTEGIRRSLDPNDTHTFKMVLNDRNIQLREARLDKYGYRRLLPDGLRVEDHFEKMSLSANPEKRVSEEELNWVVQYVVSQLKAKASKE